jgi:hypothetical protein
VTPADAERELSVEDAKAKLAAATAADEARRQRAGE